MVESPGFSRERSQDAYDFEKETYKLIEEIDVPEFDIKRGKDGSKTVEI